MLKIKIIPNLKNLNKNYDDDRFKELVGIIKKSEKYNKLISFENEIEKVEILLCNKYDDTISKLKKENPKLKIVICERYDSCTLSLHTSLEHVREVDAIFKEYVLKDRKHYTHEYVNNRYHFYLLEKDSKIKKKYLYQDDIDKIRCVPWNLKQYSNICNKYMKTLQDSNPTMDDKTVDIFLVCHPHIKHRILYEHRMNAMEKLKVIAKKYDLKIVTEELTKREYNTELIKSKICISPYGLGSRIALDQFGLLAKTIVIKPPMGHIDTTPNIYEEEMFEYCDINFDNMEEIILKILNDYEKYFEIAEKRFNNISDYEL